MRTLHDIFWALPKKCHVEWFDTLFRVLSNFSHFVVEKVWTV
jgi:hypothetical protein